jgi:L-fuconolactonase
MRTIKTPEHLSMTNGLDLPRVTRRAVLQAGAAGAATLAALGQRALAVAEETPPTIDAHTHFYDPTRPQGVPWPDKQDALLYRPVLPPEFKQLTAGHHVTGTIVIEASPWVEDNQWLLDLAAREPLIVGVVGRLDPLGDDFAKLLRRFATSRTFRGLRIGHDDLRKGLNNRGFRDNLRLLIDESLELDVNGGPEMPADVARLARMLPDLRIVINHAANLPIDGRPVPDGWLKGMQAAAAGVRVYCKVSGLVEATGRTQGDAPIEANFYRPVLDALWNTFGEDRLIYGSNWPVSDRAASYATVHKIASAYFHGKGRRPWEKFLQANALEAYGIR